MRNILLGGIAIASAFVLQVNSASAQALCGPGRPCPRHAFSGHDFGQHRHENRRDGRGLGIGAGVAGLAAGALIGGAIASQENGYYAAEPYPYDRDEEPQASVDGDSEAYCERTYRSYDPASGTYLGYDGLRHSCP